MKRPALTGTSVSSNVLTMAYVPLEIELIMVEDQTTHLRLVRPSIDMSCKVSVPSASVASGYLYTIVEGGENPRLSRMEIYALHSLAPGEQLFL